MGLTAREARLWVRGRAMVVTRSLLELRDTLPHEWTVARPPGEADPYLVCPSCRHRARLPDGRVTTLRCPRCNELFTIAWDNDAGEPSRDQLRADRRMTRRRIPRDRRTGDERRTVERRALGWAALPVERRLTERRAIALRRSGWERRGMVERRRRTVAW